MRWGLLLVLLAGCGDAGDQRYGLMTEQFEEWAAMAQRGERVLPGYVQIAESHCTMARRDAPTIRAARPLAAACDRWLGAIQVHAGH